MDSVQNELTLLFRIRHHHDRDAFSILYQKYASAIYRFVALKIAHREEAEDVAAETFAKAWQYLTNSEREEVRHFRAFMYTIARSTIIDFYRSRAKHPTESVDVVMETPDSRPSAFEAAAKSGDAEMLLQAVKQLKQEYQDVIFLRYVEEMSVKEIAEALQKKQTAVRVTLHRATKKLEEVIKRQPRNPLYES